MLKPRGIRNNNPGNIEKGEPWKGTENVTQHDSRFVTFSKPEYGIRAIVRILMTYQSRHKLYNIDDIINRWAPDVENNTEAYISQVEKYVGVGRFNQIDVRDYDIVKKLVKAIIKHENGMQPYDDETINAGLALAGVTPENSHIVVASDKDYKKDRKNKQAGVMATATGGTGVAIGAVTMVEQIDRVHALLLDKSFIFISICAVICFGLLVYQNREPIIDWFKRIFSLVNSDAYD